MWNIVSVPGTPQQTNEDSLFFGNVSNAYWYNGSSYQVENDLNSGKGYWLKFSQPNSYSIPVIISNQLQDSLMEGWNLIGTIHQNVPVSSIATNSPNILASPFYGYHKGYYQTQTLEKGKGYWIKSNQPGTLILSLPFSAGKFSHKEEIDSKWPCLIFRSSESLREIFFTEEFDYTKFDLPPIPHAKSFDVRFYNNKYVADLNSDLINVLIQSPDDEVVVEAKNASFKILHDITSEKEIFLNQGEKIKLKLDKSGSIAVKPLTEIKSYSLSQNYPNPFNSQTQIRITLPENQFVELKLYNVMGEEIKTLISEFKNKGIYSVKLNLNDLASGVYIYKLSAGNFVDSKKLVLIK